MNNIDFQELERLRRENEELKNLIAEGKELFKQLKDLINLKNIAFDGMFVAKISKIIRMIQDNPKMVEEILTYILEKYDNSTSK